MPLQRTSRDNLIYKPDGQVLTDFFWDRSRVSIIQGPIGSGTSTCCCHRIYQTACEQAVDLDGVRRSHWLIARESYPQLEKTTVRTWLEWFPEQTFGNFIASKPMGHHIHRDLSDGSKLDLRVTFMPLADPFQAVSDLASLELTGVWLNELQFMMEKEILDEALSRCSRYPSKRLGPGPSWFGLIADMNAPKEGHYVPYMRGDVPMPEEWSEDDRELMTKPEGWKFFVQPPGLIERRVNGRMVYEENPKAENQQWLQEPYIEKIRGKKKEWIDERVMNKVGLYQDGLPVYPTFSPADHVSEIRLQPISGFPIVVGLDFGREPAAIFCQKVGATWRVLSEVIGHNESAEIFAPRVRSHLATNYGQFEHMLFGDPRGADGTQATEQTAYSVFRSHGLLVKKATTNNDPELRRSTLSAILDRRGGLMIDPEKCMKFKTGMAGGYHFAKIRGQSRMYNAKPVKNEYSHIVEAFENACLGRGEGRAVLTGGQQPVKPIKSRRSRYRLRDQARS